MTVIHFIFKSRKSAAAAKGAPLRRRRGLPAQSRVLVKIKYAVRIAVAVLISEIIAI